MSIDYGFVARRGWVPERTRRGMGRKVRGAACSERFSQYIWIRHRGRPRWKQTVDIGTKQKNTGANSPQSATDYCLKLY